MRRSLLFLPGNNPNMLINGDVLGADAIILDLEDAVSIDEKDAARILVRNALRSLQYKNVDTIIRINAVADNGFWKQDLLEVVPCKPSAILVPKVEKTEEIQMIAEYLDEVELSCDLAQGTTSIIALIETAMGLENAFAIAASNERLGGLLLGAEDLTADLGCARTKEGNEIAYARGRIISAARAAGVDAYDTPFTDIFDDEGAEADIQVAKAYGFTGKAAISPRHIRPINRQFSPSKEEIEYAHEVMEVIEEAASLGKGAIALHGKMIDAPIVARAKQVLAVEAILNGGGNV